MREVEPLHPGDHIRGPEDAAVTIIEYGDYQCPHTRRAQAAIDDLLSEQRDVRYVFRHFPLRKKHELAETLARAAEAAERQGKFWPMHELLMHENPRSPFGHLERIGVDADVLAQDLNEGSVGAHVEHDLEAGRASGVKSTPTFFFNGHKHDGDYDPETLRERLEEARRQRA